MLLKLYRPWGSDVQPCCRFRCPALGDARHVRFVVCQHLANIRRMTLSTLDLKLMNAPLRNCQTTGPDRPWRIPWTLQYGPHVGLTITLGSFLGHFTVLDRIFHRISQDRHTQNIRLAARPCQGLAKKEEHRRSGTSGCFWHRPLSMNIC